MSSEVRRKLTTILAADAEGYSRVMEVDEVQGARALRSARAIFARFIDRHGGPIANTAGDGLIAEFPSVVEAVQCAIETQNELSEDSGALKFRIGIHLGDVIVDGDDLLGEGVNLAARLQAMAPAGGILISRPVYDQVHAKLSVAFDYLGEKRPKNFSHDVSVYQVTKQQGLKRLMPKVAVDPIPNSEPPSAPPEPAAPSGTLGYYGKRAALIIGALVAIDIATGDGVWAHFPSVIILALVGLLAVPSDGWRGLDAWTTRGLVLVATLLFINLATWSGSLWVIWPAGVLGFLILWRRISNSPG